MLFLSLETTVVEYEPLTHPRLTPGKYFYGTDNKFYRKDADGGLKEMKPFLKLRGGKKHKYYALGVRKSNGKYGHLNVHSLLAHHWLGPQPEGLVVRHGVKGGLVNTPDNLSYGTFKENMADKIRDGTHGWVLSESQVHAIWDAWNTGRTLLSVGTEFGVHLSQINYIIRGRKWHHVYLIRAPLSERHRLEYPERHRELVSGLRPEDDGLADDALLAGAGAPDGALPCVPCGHDS